MKTVAMWKLLFALLLAVTLPVRSAEVPVKRVDGTDIQVWIERPNSPGPGPILLAIDGSLCTPEELSEWVKWLAAQRNGPQPYTLVVVKKPSPTVPTLSPDGSYEVGPDFHCSDAFKRHYTLDQRVLDHLQALAYLRKSAPWWNGKLFIWGFSDGAHVGARVGTYTPETQKQVLIGLGGGTSLREELEQMMCPDSSGPCRANFAAQVQKIRSNPTPEQSWLGEANTFAAWQSRLDAVELNALQFSRAPVLVIHGAQDGSVPVRSARKLAAALGAPKGTVEYREIGGMNHGLGSNLPAEHAAALQSEALRWLLAPAAR